MSAYKHRNGDADERGRGVGVTRSPLVNATGGYLGKNDERTDGWKETHQGRCEGRGEGREAVKEVKMKGCHGMKMRKRERGGGGGGGEE
jgi:hypothetical protein